MKATRRSSGRRATAAIGLRPGAKTFTRSLPTTSTSPATTLTVPKSNAPPVPPYPIFADPPLHTACIVRSSTRHSHRKRLPGWNQAKARALAIPGWPMSSSRAAAVISSWISPNTCPSKCSCPLSMCRPVTANPNCSNGRTAWCGRNRPGDVHVTIGKIFEYAGQKIAERRKQSPATI